MSQCKAQNNVTFKSVSGEERSFTTEMTAAWKETHLPIILSRYRLEDICNADEFGLFYQALPSKSIHLKSERCSGGKDSKLRLAGLAAGNAMGDKLAMFVIGNSVKPHCFQHVKTLPCQYRSQKKVG